MCLTARSSSPTGCWLHSAGVAVAEVCFVLYLHVFCELYQGNRDPLLYQQITGLYSCCMRCCATGAALLNPT